MTGLAQVFDKVTNRVWMLADGEVTYPFAKDFFSFWFKQEKLWDETRNPATEAKPFHDLYDASLTLGGYAYKILLILVLYACVITLMLALAKFVLSQNPRATDEAKGKVIRILMIAMFSGTLVSVVTIIVKAFAV